jgi:hypothetical protein
MSSSTFFDQLTTLSNQFIRPNLYRRCYRGSLKRFGSRKVRNEIEIEIEIVRETGLSNCGACSSLNGSMRVARELG